MAQIWDDRYKNEEFAYGTQPNDFFKEYLIKFTKQPPTDPCITSKILMPADGEGRNGVYAAQLGWSVLASDLSIEGKNKAMKLVGDRNLQYEYQVICIIGMCLNHLKNEIIIYHKNHH